MPSIPNLEIVLSLLNLLFSVLIVPVATYLTRMKRSIDDLRIEIYRDFMRKEEFDRVNHERKLNYAD